MSNINWASHPAVIEGQQIEVRFEQRNALVLLGNRPMYGVWCALTKHSDYAVDASLVIDPSKPIRLTGV